ncbi:hypothetical protein GCM10020219_041720 [Nonomuraea dietziae]
MAGPRPHQAGCSYRQTTALALGVQALVWLGVLADANVWMTGGLLAVGGAGATLTSVAVGSARQALPPTTCSDAWARRSGSSGWARRAWGR